MPELRPRKIGRLSPMKTVWFSQFIFSALSEAVYSIVLSFMGHSYRRRALSGRVCVPFCRKYKSQSCPP